MKFEPGKTYTVIIINEDDKESFEVEAGKADLVSRMCDLDNHNHVVIDGIDDTIRPYSLWNRLKGYLSLICFIIILLFSVLAHANWMVTWTVTTDYMVVCPQDEDPYGGESDVATLAACWEASIKNMSKEFITESDAKAFINNGLSRHDLSDFRLFKCVNDNQAQQ